LTYEPIFANTRRRLATARWAHLRTSENNSLDEYPFATTEEGGPRARVMAVPDWEQSIQGGTYSLFILDNLIVNGDPFIVLVVP
jgi:hypothetical protein